MGGCEGRGLLEAEGVWVAGGYEGVGCVRLCGYEGVWIAGGYEGVGCMRLCEYEGVWVAGGCVSACTGCGCICGCVALVSMM